MGAFAISDAVSRVSAVLRAAILQKRIRLVSGAKGSAYPCCSSSSNSSVTVCARIYPLKVPTYHIHFTQMFLSYYEMTHDVCRW